MLAHKSRRKMSLTVRLGLGLFCLFVAAVAVFILLQGRDEMEVAAGGESSSHVPVILTDGTSAPQTATLVTETVAAKPSQEPDISRDGDDDAADGAGGTGMEAAEEDAGKMADVEPDGAPRRIQLVAPSAGATHPSFAVATRDPDAARTQMRSFVKEIVRTPVVMEDGETYEQITLPGNTLQPEESGVPNVPRYEELIHVPNGVEVALLVDNVRYREFEQATPLAPAQPPKPGGIDPDGNKMELPFVKQADAYSRVGYPEQAVVSIGEDIRIRGQRFVKVVYNPLQYDPVAGKLRVAVEADWALTFDGTPVAAREDPKWRGRKRSFQLDADPWATPPGPEPEATPSPSAPVRMSPEREPIAEPSEEPMTEAGEKFFFDSATYNVDEGAGNVTITVKSSKTVVGTLVVNYTLADGTATGGIDYDNTGGSVTFNNSASETFTVGITNDLSAEGDETFTITLSGQATQTPDVTTVTILDDDTAGTVQLPSSSLNHNENAGAITVLVSRVSGSSGAVSVDYATADGTATAGSDYVATNGTLNWADGDSAAKPLVVEVIDDAVADSSTNETFTINLSNPGGGVALGLSSMTVNLADDEIPDIPGSLQFSSSTYSVAEAGGSKQITVNRVGGSAGAVGVSYITANGSAVAGLDYSSASGTLSWSDGETAAKTFNVSITDDGTQESDETISLSLSSPTGGAGLGSPNTATLTIIDDDEPVLGPEAEADYLILTADAYYDAVLPLAKWKHSKGFKVHVTKFSELPGTSWTDVKNFFVDAYSNGTMTTYGLIVGDHADVPGYQITYHPACSGDNMPFYSDHPYACVDGTDNYPDMVVTRLSGDTVEQITTLVNKVLTYEKTPDTGSWYRNVLIAGQFQDSDPKDLIADRWFMEDLHRIADFLGPDYGFFGTWNGLSEIDKGYTIKTALKWDTSTTSNLQYRTATYNLRITPPNPVPASWKAMGTGTKTEISAAVNSGVSMVFHRDHGYATYTGDWSDGLGWGSPDYRIPDVDALLNGNKLPVVFSLNCGTGHWDVNPTGQTAPEDGFSEHWVRNANGGAVWITGAARLSYSGPNDNLVCAIMDGFYDDFSTYTNGAFASSWRVSETMVRAKGAVLTYNGSDATSYGTLTARMFNIFGDPEMMLRTDTPTNIVVTGVPATAALGSLNNVTITATVGGSALANARFCISKWGSDDYWVGFTDGSGQATLGMTPSSIGKYDVVVCGDAHDTAEIHNNTIPYTNQIEVTSSIDAPTDVSATVIAPNQIDLAWTDNSTNETGFAIERSLTGGDDYVHIGSVAANATSYSDTAVAPGNMYYYKVTGTNATEFSGSGMTSVFIVDFPLVVNSTNTAALTETSCGIYGELQDGLFADAWICWGASDGDAATSAWDHVVYVGSVSQGVPFGIDVTGLATNTTYFYRCYVTNSAGIVWSGIATAFSGNPAGVAEPGTPGLWYGEVPGNPDTTTPNPRTLIETNVASRTENTIAANTTEIYTGYIYDEDGQISFTEDIDDCTRIWVDGNLVVTSSIWSDRISSGNLNLTPGWHAIEIRISNGSGGSGPHSSPGIGYDPNGGTAWQTLQDPGDGSFLSTTSYVASTIANLSPTGITDVQADLNGLLNASGTNYAVYVYYGTTDGGSNAGSWAASAYVGSWSDLSTNVSCSVGLAAGTTNYYTFMASNTTKTAWASPSWQFKVPGTSDPSLPVINNWDGATGITDTHSLLIGSLTSTGGSPTTVTCYWNANSDPGITTTGWDYSRNYGVASSTGSYTNDTADTAALSPGTTYYYRYRAANSHGTNWSGAKGFTTLIPPTVDNATGASSLSETSAALYGELTAGANAEAWICWGASDVGTVSTGDWDNVISIGSVTESVVFSTIVSSLDTNRTYFYRCYASNGVGSDWSDAATAFSGTPAGEVGYQTEEVLWIDFSQLTDVPLQSGFQAFSWDLDTAHTQTYASASATDGTIDVTLSGQSYYRDYDPITSGDYVGLSDLLSDSALRNEFGTMTLTLGDLVSGTYVMTTYHHGTQYGSGVFTQELSDAFVTDEMVFSGVGTEGTSPSSIRTVVFPFVSDTGDIQVKITGGLVPAGNPHIKFNGFQLAAASVQPIANKAPTAITSSQATFNGVVYPWSTGYDVYVYWGTTDGGTNAASWNENALVGSYPKTGVATDASYSATSLPAGSTTYYTFMVSNATEAAWASPSWQFTTPGEPKATPTVSAWPTTTPITYGQTYADAGLDGGTASVDGTFSYNSPATVPNAGTSAAAVKFTPADTTNYNTVAGSVDVVVSKASATVTLSGTNQTYDGSARTVAAVTDPVGLTVDLTYAGKSWAPTNAGSYAVTGVVSEINYEGSAAATLVVAKADPNVTNWPSASDIQDGQAVSNSVLIGGSATAPGTFSFDNPANVPPQGTNTVDITFTPNDTTNYVTVGGSVSLVVTKVKAPATVTLGNTSQVYNGSPISVTTTTDPLGLTVNVTYDGSGTAPTDAGEYAVLAIIDNADYAGSTNGTLVISKAASVVNTWPSAAAITYGQAVSNATLTGGDTTPTGSFSYDAPSTLFDAGTNTADVTFTPDDADNYLNVAGTVDVTVSKATATLTLSDTNQTYSAAAIAVTVTTAPTGLVYNVTYDGDASLPTNAGTYAVSAVVDETNYDGSANGTLVIGKATSLVNTWPTALAITYGQAVSNATLSGGDTTPAGSFSYTAPSTLFDAGTHTADVTFTPGDTNNYLNTAGTVAVTVNQATPSVTWPSASAITVGQALSNSVLSGGSSTPSGSFSFDDPSVTPSEGTYGAAVTFTPDDSVNWTTASSNVAIIVLPLPPSVPTGLSATPSLGQVDLSWSPVSGATSYKVKRASVPGGPYSTVGTPATTNYSDSVANGATYYYVVSAVNAGGEGAYSDEVSATLLHVLPFSDNFEALDIADLNGQNGWNATSAVVQTNVAIDARAASISTESGLMSQEFANSVSNVWTDFEIQPVFCPDDMTPSSTNATVFVFFNTNGNPVVYDGPALTTITNVSMATGTWVRVTIESDYAAKTWNLYIDSSPVATDLGFYSTNLTYYRKFTVSGAGDTSATLDDLTIGPVSPFRELLSLTVFSPHGSPNPAGTNWYTSGTTVNFEMTDSPFIIATNSKYEAIGWIGSGSLTSGTGTNGSFAITNDTTLTWQWTTNYWIELSTSGN